MGKHTLALLRLLRMELTATHQQFFHMLALRAWDDRTILPRVTRMDATDFRNAMAIIEHLVGKGAVIALSMQRIRPGTDEAGILAAERDLEAGFAAMLAADRPDDPDAAALFDRAAAQRPAYRAWLDEEAAARGPGRPPATTGAEMAGFLAQQLALVEQAMLHAFLHWHHGDRALADNAWRLSGAAMLHATALVRCGARIRAVPVPAETPAVVMAPEPAAAFAADMALVRRCAEHGRNALAAERNPAVQRFCTRIIEDCDLIAPMRQDADFPAVFGRSPVFESFAATREKFLD